ncbi:hypothetical protein EJ06DRAFT_89258 [Trichodelitschia bisporula]|uniref:Uncharacterized protein n=1 Tax=Trichodelitschia bisporula TaxID=703511 RepID=A0A6G1HRN0_9PEZI|nr:hypothetical protein EJ06DRAFT_89258 [Trichodelitschia bisporula]
MKLSVPVAFFLATLVVAAPSQKRGFGSALAAAKGQQGQKANAGAGAGAGANKGGNKGGNTGTTQTGNTGNSNASNGTNTGTTNTGTTNTGTTNTGNSNAGNSTTGTTNTGNTGAANQPAIQDGANDVNAAGSVSASDALLINTAIDAWQRDTGVVTNFLNMGASFTDDATFKNQALIAHSAEVDELTHKNVLDQFTAGNANVQAANATLTSGAFQLVVDRLFDMSVNGRADIAGIDQINKDRCVNVLPNIDTYLRESAQLIGGGQKVIQSVRPAACGNIVPGQNGALKVNEIPAGYVNGKLQNGNSNTNPNIPATAADDG